MLKNGTGFKDIPQEYQATVQEHLTIAFTDGRAQTDEDEYSILADMIQKMERGELIIDETGNSNNQLLSMGWNDERVTADMALSKPKKLQAKDLLLIGAIMLLALAFVGYLLGMFSRGGNDELPVAVAEEITEITPEATVIITPISQQALEIATSLGGSIKIAEPRTVDITGGRLNRTLAIVPAKPNTNGAIGFLPEDKRDSAVVWVQGTVINYVIGMSSELVHALDLNDEIKLRSNTGQTMIYHISEIFDTEPQQVEIFSQRLTPGITIFELPAKDGSVRVARAIYQSSNETIQTSRISGRIGEKVESHPDIDVIVSDVSTNQLANRLIQVEAHGIYVGQKEGISQELPVIAFLGNNDTQFTPVVGGEISQKGNWSAIWEIPEELLGDVKLFLKPITSQQPIEFDLSDIEHPRERLNFTVTQNHWDLDQALGVFTIQVVNDGNGDAYIFAHEVSLTSKMEANQQPTFQADQTFPLFLPPGEVVEVTFSYQPPPRGEMPSVTIQLLDHLYDVELPASVAASEEGG